MRAFISTLAFLILASSANAGITQKDFTGIGNIHVLNSSDWHTASPTADKIGCLNERGKLVAATSRAACGIFSKSADFPYTLSTKKGNCTFDDASQERNTDSKYGAGDHAWNCNATYDATVYDSLYTIDGFPHVFLCFGDVACYYDAKKAPECGEELSLWQYHWGSQQMGITPGHIQLVLVWNKIGELPKRKEEDVVPGPHVGITDGVQMSLLGQKKLE